MLVVSAPSEANGLRSARIPLALSGIRVKFGHAPVIWMQCACDIEERGNVLLVAARP